MGIYLNPGNELFRQVINSAIYVDKTGLIDFTNSVMNTTQKEICVSRPRRFGKSVAENMLAAYYSRGCDSRELFSGLKISGTADFETHLNKHNVIHIDIQKFLSSYPDMKEMLSGLTAELFFDLKMEFKGVEYYNTKDLSRVFKDIYSQKNEKFIFIIDEWDSIFRVHKDDKSSQKEYLDFLRNLLKDQPYVSLVYMTGILPVKKYGEHSALNMFDEYSMTNQGALAEFTGFTEKEVEELCGRYGMSFEETKKWYDGYTVNGFSIYNPKSVVTAMTSKVFDNYWSKTESYEALKEYIKRDFDGLRETITRLIAGEEIKTDTGTFENDMVTFYVQDDILTLLVHLGYLSYNFEKSTVVIPNYEVRQQFMSTVNSLKWTHVTEAVKQSDELLKYTLARNSEKVSEMIRKVHMQETSILKYNDENSLSCVLALAYYSARDTYSIYREMPGGEGFADLVFVPLKGNSNPAMIIELKCDKGADTAINQIKRRKYADSLKDYKGNVLLVGISYNRKSKEHECMFEMAEV